MKPEENVIVEEVAIEAVVEAPKKGKAKKDEPTASEMNAAAGATEDFYKEQGAKSQENRKNGQEDVKFNLTNKTRIKVLENHGFMKAGTTHELSDVALAIHDKAGMKYEKL